MTEQWRQLAETISRMALERRIGNPRALRVTVHTKGDERAAQSLRREIASAASVWFGGAAQTVRSMENGGASADLLVWHTGSSAVISVSSADRGRFGGSLMLMGTRGSLYHDFGGSEL